MREGSCVSRGLRNFYSCRAVYSQVIFVVALCVNSVEALELTVRCECIVVELDGVTISVNVDGLYNGQIVSSVLKSSSQSVCSLQVTIVDGILNLSDLNVDLLEAVLERLVVVFKLVVLALKGLVNLCSDERTIDDGTGALSRSYVVLVGLDLVSSLYPVDSVLTSCNQIVVVEREQSSVTSQLSQLIALVDEGANVSLGLGAVGSVILISKSILEVSVNQSPLSGRTLSRTCGDSVDCIDVFDQAYPRPDSRISAPAQLQGLCFPEVPGKVASTKQSVFRAP